MPSSSARIDRGADRRVGMAEEPGGEFAEEIDIAVAVGVPQPAALAANDAERERRIEQRAAGIAAGHHLAGRCVVATTLRIGRRVAFDGGGQSLPQPFMRADIAGCIEDSHAPVSCLLYPVQ